MKIERELALKILKYLKDNKEFIFPFVVMCKGYEKEQVFSKSNDYIDLVPYNDYENILNNQDYNDFKLRVNLETVDDDTLHLMLKGFIDKIENTNILDKISTLAVEYRKSWKEELCESESIEEYGLNEFIGGKAEAYEECFDIVTSKVLTKQLLSTDIIIS